MMTPEQMECIVPPLHLSLGRWAWAKCLLLLARRMPRKSGDDTTVRRKCVKVPWIEWSLKCPKNAKMTEFTWSWTWLLFCHQVEWELKCNYVTGNKVPSLALWSLVACENLAHQTPRSNLREFVMSVGGCLMESKGKCVSWAQKILEPSTGKPLGSLLGSHCCFFLHICFPLLSLRTSFLHSPIHMPEYSGIKILNYVTQF